MTVSATGQNKIYDGNSTATVTLADNRVSGDVLTVSSTSATFTSKTVGTTKAISVTGINVTGTDSGNYTFNVTAATSANISTKAISGSVVVDNKAFNNTTAATILTRTLVGVVAGDIVTYTGTILFQNIYIFIAYYYLCFEVMRKDKLSLNK